MSNCPLCNENPQIPIDCTLCVPECPRFGIEGENWRKIKHLVYPENKVEVIKKFFWHLQYNFYGWKLGFGWGTAEQADKLDYEAHPKDAFSEDWRN